MFKPILLIDFDGVIHDYSAGWQGATVINGDPIPGAFAALTEYADEFEVRIFSSRSSEPGGRRAMQEWFHRHGWPGVLGPEGFEPEGLSFPTEKGPAFLTIDDRAICFKGQWPDAQALLEFRPWYKLDNKPEGEAP